MHPHCLLYYPVHIITNLRCDKSLVSPFNIFQAADVNVIFTDCFVFKKTESFNAPGLVSAVLIICLSHVIDLLTKLRGWPECL